MVSVNISVVLFSVRFSKWENICVANFHAINFRVRTHFAEVDGNEKVLMLMKFITQVCVSIEYLLVTSLVSMVVASF